MTPTSDDSDGERRSVGDRRGRGGELRTTPGSEGERWSASNAFRRSSTVPVDGRRADWRTVTSLSVSVSAMTGPAGANSVHASRVVETRGAVPLKRARGAAGQTGVDDREQRLGSAGMPVSLDAPVVERTQKEVKAGPSATDPSRCLE